MKILLTGASSFTGYWFACELVKAGHEVVATFQGTRSDYQGLKVERIDRLPKEIDSVWECSFGDTRFIDLLGRSEFDVCCHHGADVRNYRSPDFDVAGAVEGNTRNAQNVLKLLKGSGTRLILTGSVFEAGEGAGSEGLPAFSPYGLSKELTWRIFQYYACSAEVSIGKFVVPNPFGPLEEPRFTSYLMRSWKQGSTAHVRTPAYVRDNIHIPLLARAYRDFVENSSQCQLTTAHPSGYIESQGQFARRFSSEMRDRLGFRCDLVLDEQTEFSEPMIRVNTEAIWFSAAEESKAWDQIAEFYA